MKLLSRLFLYYCAGLILFVVIAGLLGSRNTESFVLQLFLLPVALYFIWAVVKNARSGEVDVNLNKQGLRLAIFVVIFVLLLALGVINLNKGKGDVNEQGVYPESSPLIFPKAK